MTGYDRYVAHCKAIGQTPPTREWWDWACAQAYKPEYRNADQREIDRERSEGWAYGY